MSGGWACTCPRVSVDGVSGADRMKNWVVFKRHYNTSAFSGYRYTSSAYSSVHCTKCQRIWRTKAKYVNDLPTGTLR